MTPLVAVAAAALLDRAARGGRRARRAERRWSSRTRRAPPRRSTARASRWSARPGRSGWAPRSDRAWPPASAAPCSSWAATTPRWSRRRPTSTSRCAPSCSPPPGTAGQRCTTMRRLIVHESVADAVVEKRGGGLPDAAGGRPVRARHPRRPAALPAPPSTLMQEALAQAVADGGTVVVGGERGRRRAPARLRPSRAGADAGADRGRPARDVRADPLRAHLPRPRRGDRTAQRRAAGAVVVDLHERPARRPSCSWPPTAPTAGSSTSTSGRRARRSAVRSAARRPRAAAASRARTPGAPTCGGRRTRSTTRATCRWRRGSASADPLRRGRPARRRSSEASAGGRGQPTMRAWSARSPHTSSGRRSTPSGAQPSTGSVTPAGEGEGRAQPDHHQPARAADPAQPRR